MKRYKLALLCLAPASLMSAQNAACDAGAEGYLSRGIGMYENKNYNGCIDQLTQLKRMEAPASAYEDADFYIALSKFNRNDGDCVEALRKFLTDYPASVRRHDARLAIADYYFYNDRFEEAVDEYGKIPESAFDSYRRADLLYRKGFSLIRVKDYDRAAACFGKLKTDSRYREQATYYGAVIDYSKGDYKSAANGFRSVGKKSGLYGEARFYLCQIMFQDGDYQGVRSESDALFSSKLPSEMETELYRIAGESEYHLGGSARAVSLLGKYVELADGKPERSALYALGICEFRNADYEQATAHLGAVTDADDEMAQSAYLYVGQAYLRQDNVNAASLAFEKAYKMPYDESVRETAFYNYAIAQSRGGRTPFSGSVKLFQDFLNDFPQSRYASDVEDYIINSYLSNKDYDNALKSINALKKPSKKMLGAKQNVLYRLGMRELTNGNTAEAAGYLSQADKLAAYDKSTAAEVSLWLAEAYYRQRKYADAETRYAAYPGGANAAKASYGLGYARYQQRKYDSARTAFEKAAPSLDGELKADAYNRIADCFYYSGDFSGAGSFYDKAFALNTSQNAFSLYQKGMMQGLSRDNEAKIATMNRVVADYPQSVYAPKALLEKAQTYVSLGKNAQGVKAYESLLGSYPQSAESRQGQLQLALLLNNMGKSEESRAQYEDLVRKYPSSEEAKVAIDDLKRIYAAEGRLDEFSGFLRSAGSSYEIDENEMAALTFEAAESEYLDKGKTDKLEAFLKKYPTGNNAGQAAYYIAESAYQNGKRDAALTYAEKALSLSPDASFAESALGMCGDLLLSRGEYAKAAESFRKLDAKSTTTFGKQRAALGLVRAALGEKKYADVKANADKLLATEGLTPEVRAEVLYARASAEMATGDKKKAVADYTELADNSVETLYGSMAAVELGSYYYNAADYKAAESAVNKLLDSSTTHQYWMARGFILLSDIYAKRGDKFQAREYLESLKSNYPGKEADIFEMIDKRLKALK